MPGKRVNGSSAHGVSGRVDWRIGARVMALLNPALALVSIATQASVFDAHAVLSAPD